MHISTSISTFLHYGCIGVPIVWVSPEKELGLALSSMGSPWQSQPRQRGAGSPGREDGAPNEISKTSGAYCIRSPQYGGPK